MALRLALQVPHLSIKQFPTIDLPDLTVVTGRNGSGKSHLLEAITQGKITCNKDGVQLNPSLGEIRSYNWNNMVPQDTGAYSSETSRAERVQAISTAKQMLISHNIVNVLRNQAQAYGISLLTDKELFEASALDINTKFNTNNGTDYVNIRNQYLSNTEQQVLNTNPAFKGPIQIARNLGKDIFSITEDELLFESLPNYGSSELFQQSFSKLFVEYRDLGLRNEIRDNRFKRGRSTKPGLTDEEFIAKHGPAPWDFVNKSLEQAKLDFRINEPSFEDYAPYQPRLTKISTNDEISFSNLSSGEKIIMSFAFCLYYATDSRQLSNYPKCLLLDEIDAPLHPAMTRGLISTIKDVLVDQYKISVIMTSHSPSTVALSPETSVCIMQDGRRGLNKTTKNEALNILTEGVPTIALSYDGRRHVFVESNADAKTYPLLYDLLKSSFASERSLEFISTGVKGNSGEERNTGCSVVKKLVGQFSTSKHNSILGLLDWDGKQSSGDRIFVLGEGTYNGLENVILDPLILSAFLCRRFKDQRSKIGIHDDMSYIDFLNLPPEHLQQTVTLLTTVVFGSSPSSTVQSRYCGGLHLEVDRRYCETDDHTLETTVLEAFPALKAVAKGAGTLMQMIIFEVLSDKKAWIPQCVFDVFQRLLSTDSH